MAFEPVTIGADTFKTEEELKAHIQELEKGNLRQQEFTKKTQELSASRTEVERQKAELAEAKEISDALKENPDIREELERLLEKKMNGTAAQSAAASVDIEALTKQITEQIKKEYGPVLEDTKTLKERMEAEDNKKNFEMFVSQIEADLKAEGRADVYGHTGRRDVIVKAAFDKAGQVYAETKNLMSPDEMKKFVKEKTEEIFGDSHIAEVIASAEKRKKIGNGSGAAGASELKFVKRGSAEQTNKISGIWQKMTGGGS